MWLFLSLLAAALWASVNIIDKVVLSKYVRNPLFVAVVTGFMSLFFSLSLILFAKIAFSLNFVVLFSVLSGIIYMFGLIFYFRSLQLDEVSRISSLMKLSPVFVLFFAALFLNEVFTTGKYLGIILVIAGSILVSIKKFGIKIKYTKALWLMILSTFFISIPYIIGKYLLGFLDYWNYFFWFNIGVFIPSLLLFYFLKANFMTAIRNLKGRITLLLAADSLYIIADFLVIIAFSANPVSLVYTVTSVQPLFVLFYALILSRYFPKILEEDMNKKKVLMKLISIFIIIIGIYLIS